MLGSESFFIQGASGQPAGNEVHSSWRRFGVTSRDAQRAVRQLWDGYGDQRLIKSMVDVSAKVSTNRVFLLRLEDGTNIFAKVSNYGSSFLFREDHDRVLRLRKGLQHTRFADFLAPPLTKPNRVGEDALYTYYDGNVWAVLYGEVQRRDALPRILEAADIENLAREIAEFHTECERATIDSRIPRTSTSISSDIVHLLDLASDRSAAKTFRLPDDGLEVLRKHAHRFLGSLERLGYADMVRVPILVDWNLGNFSIERLSDGSFSFFSRWDYDWFRTDVVTLDFYFLSRVSSLTGDRTKFSYGLHTLSEPRFARFLAAYNEIRPLSDADVEMIVETYRFFILHYVLSVGDHFFRTDLWDTFKLDAVNKGLPSVDSFDATPLYRALGRRR